MQNSTHDEASSKYLSDWKPIPCVHSRQGWRTLVWQRGQTIGIVLLPKPGAQDWVGGRLRDQAEVWSQLSLNRRNSLKLNERPALWIRYQHKYGLLGIKRKQVLVSSFQGWMRSMHKSKSEFTPNGMLWANSSFATLYFHWTPFGTAATAIDASGNDFCCSPVLCLCSDLTPTQHSKHDDLSFHNGFCLGN